MQHLTASFPISELVLVAFSADGKDIIAHDAQAQLYQWDAWADQPVIEGPSRINYVGIRSTAYYPKTEQLLLGTSPGLVLLQGPASEEALELAGHSTTVLSVAFNSTGNMGLSGSGGEAAIADENIIIAWNLETGQETQRFEGHTDAVVGVAFQPGQESQVLSVSRDGTMRLWDLGTGEEIRQFAYNSPLTSIAISPDGQVACTGTNDNNIILWKIDSGEVIDLFTGHNNAVLSVAISPDGRFLLSGSADKTTRLWDIAARQSIRHFAGNKSKVTRVTFSPDGKYAVSGESPSITIWRIDELDSLVIWVKENRYVREITCAERKEFGVDPQCDFDTLVNPLPTVSKLDIGFDREQARLVFSEDFESDGNWIDFTNGDFARNATHGWLDWLARREMYQLYAHPIDRITGPVQFRFRINAQEWENNNNIDVGLVESLTGSYFDDGFPTGVFVEFGWVGGGTNYPSEFISFVGRYMNNGYSSYRSWNTPDTYISYGYDTWYWIEVTVVGQQWLLNVFEEDANTLVDTLSGTMSQVHSSYNYIALLNTSRGDWPTGYGMIDDIEVYANSLAKQ